MEKKFNLIVNNNPIKKKRENIIENEQIKSLEKENIKIKKILNEGSNCQVLFIINEKCEILFELEKVLETIVVDYDSSELNEEYNIILTKLCDEFVNLLRFTNKDHYIAMPTYYIHDLDHYKIRKTEEFIEEINDELKKINNLSEVGTLDDFEYEFFEEEDKDISLYISGLDGKKIADKLKKEKYIEDYEVLQENLYELIIKEKEDWTYSINKKIVLQRELNELGYSIWLDYK